jgi:hypothetical protein
MNRSICSLVLAICFATSAFAAEVSVDSNTIFRIEKRDVSGANKQNIAPATQFLGLDADKLADGNLSLHFYGWGRYDLGDKSFNDDRADGSVTYGYLQYRFKEANANIRAGRFFVHEGIINEQVDGVAVRTDLPLGFGLSAFGGATVHTSNLFGETSDGKGDSIFGGRANYRYKGMLELGVSMVDEDSAPLLQNYAKGNHRLLGGDIWFSPHRVVEILGHTSYNRETNGVAEHSYLLNFKPIPQLILSGEFNELNDKRFFYSWSMFSGAAFNPDDKSRSMGITGTWTLSKGIEVSADYKHYRREIGKADRYGGVAKFFLPNNFLRSGISYHYLQADSGFAITGTPSASYHELRGYALHDSNSYFAAIDLLGYFFKEKIYNESSDWQVIGSLGYHITPALALSGDISYGRNPQFTEEAKGLIRLTYNMTFESKGGKK